MMTYSFTPSEVEKVTGVSVTLQRDWRRRGIIPKRSGRGRARFNIDDLISMIVMKIFSETGFAVASTVGIASLAQMPVRAALQRIEGDNNDIPRFLTVQRCSYRIIVDCDKIAKDIEIKVATCCNCRPS